MVDGAAEDDAPRGMHRILLATLTGRAMVDGAAEDDAQRGIRRILLATLTCGLLGAAAELYLLGHYEAPWQLPPVVLIALALPIVAACWCAPRAGVVRSLQAVMASLVVAGVVGMQRHFADNLQFEREVYADAGGTELLWNTLAGAVPTLAPGALCILGLVGLAYAHQHPGIRRRRATRSAPKS